MSNYGPKGYGLYNQADNQLRKESRTTDGYRSFSGKQSVEASHRQQDRMLAKQKRLNRKQPVKVYSPEEYMELTNPGFKLAK